MSRTGVVACGVEFPDGSAAVHWPGDFASTTVWPGGIEHVRAVHGHGGSTEVQWIDYEARGHRSQPSTSLAERLAALDWY